MPDNCDPLAFRKAEAAGPGATAALCLPDASRLQRGQRDFKRPMG